MFASIVAAELGVAGVQTPAFVERLRTCCRRCRRASVSPGFRLRPSLSGAVAASRSSSPPGVAGVQTPAFVERSPPRTPRTRGCAVSPGFRLRPSLSELALACRIGRCGRGVAGVQTPAFVERICCSRPMVPSSVGVAGVQTPAFVERRRGEVPEAQRAGVSPGFRLRPSLSSLPVRGHLSKGLGVAGVQTPAFVERFTSQSEA